MAREQLYDAERSLTETGIAVAKHAARLGIRKRNPKNRMTDEIADFLRVKRYINTLRTRQGAMKKAASDLFGKPNRWECRDRHRQVIIQK